MKRTLNLKKTAALCLAAFFLSMQLAASGVLAASTGKNTEIKEPDQLYALSACLMDGDTGRVLFSKNGNEVRAMASTTKIMTLIVTLETTPLDTVVTVSENAARQPDVQLNICTGEQYYLKDLLYSLMLESHNDAAVAIAEQVGGSVEGFAGLMNQKAAELGLSQTHFITPNGLDAKDDTGIHGTTAEELAKIMSYCITDSPRKEEFLEITRTPSYSFSDLEGKRSFACNNHNAFLNMMEGALTGKTGFTSDAGYCYVGALRRDKRTFVVALLGCGWPNNKSYKWSDTKKLMNYGLDHYEQKTIYDDSPNLPEIPVVDGIGEGNGYKEPAKTALTVKAEPLQILLREDETVKITYQFPKQLEAPVAGKKKVGSVSYVLNERKIEEYPIYTARKVKKINYLWCLEKIFDYFLSKA